LSDFDIVSKMDSNGKDGLGHRKGFHCIKVSMCFVPSHYCVFSLPLVLFAFFGRQCGYKANSSSVLVLNAKGGEINAKATGSATTCEFFIKNY
jgi:hypothetical protein